MKKTLNVEETRRKIRAAFAQRHAAARTEALTAFTQAGVPDLFSDADLVLKELKAIQRYILAGCMDGIPSIKPFTASLIQRMLTVVTSYSYDAWVLQEPLSDDAILQAGAFCDDDAYLANFCVERGQDTLVERHGEYTAQRKVLRAFNDCVRAFAVFAKEIGARASAEAWLRAYNIILRYDADSLHAPYSPSDMTRLFGYIDDATSELYVAWMYPQLPTLRQLAKEVEA